MDEGRVALGLDVGGTKVAGFVVSERGEVRDRVELPTPAQDAEAIMQTLFAAVEELRSRAEPVALGVGAAGMVEAGTGTMRWAPNIAWRDLPIRDRVAERFALPVVVDNDANAAAWGEYRAGAGRGYRHLLMITVGTGIGGGIVMDGQLYRGAHGFAAEIGHIIVEPGGPRCGCGNLGCWEQVASGQALDRAATEAARSDPEGGVARAAAGAPPSGRHVATAAGNGDEDALAILAEVGLRLGQGMAGLANVLDPDAILIGGGVAEIGAPLLDPARAAFLASIEAPGHRPEVPVVAAALGNDAGGIGAGLLALEMAP